MHRETRLAFTQYLGRIAELNDVSAAEVATTNFSVAPAVEQTLEEKLQLESDFLSRISFNPVIQQEGDKVGVNVTRTIAGRTNTAAGTRRTPTDPTDTSDEGRYRCEKTDFDTAIKYSKLDAWRHKPEFQTLVTTVILKQQGRDRIMIGWNGTSVAAQTDRVANPLLQDVNKGWLFKIRTYAPARVLNDGDLTVYDNGANNPGVKAIYVHDAGTLFDGANATTANADYVNLDALVKDATELLDEWHRDDTDLVVILGRDLQEDKYFPIINSAANTATEIEARDRILESAKKVGGKRAVAVPFFPANALLITSLDNLAIYFQEGTRRRMIKDEPALDQIEDYQSVNEAYVVEDYGRTALVENIVMGPAAARAAHP
jgi:hypothetical protein